MVFQFRGFSQGAYDPRHRVVTDPAEFWAAISWLEKHDQIAVDTETSGTAWFRHARICGVSVSAWDGHVPQCFYFPCRHQTREKQLPAGLVMAGMRRLLGNPRITKGLHNTKFDRHMFTREGVTIEGLARDTMLEAHLADENNPLALKDRAAIDLKMPEAHVFEAILDAEVSRRAAEAGMGVEEYRDRFGYAQIDVGLAGVYAAWDVDFTLRLMRLYDDIGIRTFFKQVYDVEIGLERVLHDVEERGLPLDVPYVHQLTSRMDAAMASLRPQLFEALGGYTFDPNKDDEVRDILQRRLGLELWKRTPKGDRMSVDAEVLEHFSDTPGPAGRFCKVLKEFRDASKIRGTYTESLLEFLGDDGCVHGSFKSYGTNTGRLSCEKPNLQNIAGDSNARAIAATGLPLKKGGVDPWSVKRAFIVPPGAVRLMADYSQIELRVLCKYSMDPVMLDVYLRNGDIHSRTAIEVAGEATEENRRDAKVINFGLSYCMSAVGFSRQTKKSREEAEEWMARFFRRYNRISPFREEFWEECRRHTPARFINMFGAPRRIPDLHSFEQWRRMSAERKAIGSLIQGTAAWLTKISMVRLDKAASRLGLKLRSTVHDEISADAPKAHAREAAQEMVYQMEDFPQFYPVPILVDVKTTQTNQAEKADPPKDWNLDHVWKFAA